MSEEIVNLYGHILKYDSSAKHYYIYVHMRNTNVFREEYQKITTPRKRLSWELSCYLTREER